MPPHPTTKKRSSFTTFWWRYFTGQHLDGKKRTNATWLTRGTVPPHHVNWWTAKPQLHRVAWRIALIIVPVGWVVAFILSPEVEVNLTLIGTVCVAPYAIHHGLLTLVNHLPSHTVVFVNDNVRAEDIDAELDDIAIPELMTGTNDDVQKLLDGKIASVPNPAQRRRS